MTQYERGAYLEDLPDRNWNATAGSVLLLAPSHNLGGGIERYIEAVEWALGDQQVKYQRVDLSRAGARGHARMLRRSQDVLRTSSEPTCIVVGHIALLPVAMILSREADVSGVCVLFHGCELWRARRSLRKNLERLLLKRPEVRTVAVSGFTAGTVARHCKTTILPPGLSKTWFETLVRAANETPRPAAGTSVATAFRLASWREKGLPELLGAVAALGRPDIHLTVCGSGQPPPDLIRHVAGYDWCTVRAGLSDYELAQQLAMSDLFALATRTRFNRGVSGEGFGLVLLEAQVAGTAVIAPAHGGSSDAYLEGITGMAPTNEKTETLINVLGDLLQDPVRLAWMGRRASAWARQSYAPTRYARLVTRRLLG